MLRLRLRWKLLLYTSTLLLGLIAGTLLFVNYQAEKFVSDGIAAGLQQGQQRVRIVESARMAGLRLTAQSVAGFPGLKALLDVRDLPTTRDFLQAIPRDPGTDLLIVLDTAGNTIARTDVADAAAVADVRLRWIQPLLDGRAATGILSADSRLYFAAAAPAEAQGAVFGFVIAGDEIDSAFAAGLRSQSQDEVVIVGDRVLGSTLPLSGLPWRSSADWERTGVADEAGQARRTMLIEGESYIGLPVPLGGDEKAGLVAVILQSRDRALAPYRRIQFGLLVLFAVAAVAGVAASAVQAGSLSAAIGKLVQGTEQVAAGNFDSALDIRSGDEIGDLATAFNQMIRGLRERADMQKFVSRSTIEMIQSRPGAGAAAGERKLLTIFFSDMRGFTAISENLAPEEVVHILNDSLSLQADCVKQYGGDVDKYVGDSVVALFSGDNSTLRAARCALAIHQALGAYNTAHPAQVPVEVGIGIASGEVILGSIGGEDRRDFTAIGSHVNLSARLCGIARPRETLMAESAYQSVRGAVAAVRLEPLVVKGFSEPISVYRLESAGVTSAAGA